VESAPGKAHKIRPAITGIQVICQPAPNLGGQLPDDLLRVAELQILQAPKPKADQVHG
jgi:hypothetical protein